MIPCLNEGKAIGRVVREVRNHLPSVLVVDDGSTDDTGARAHAAGAQVIRHATPQGKGAALRAGWTVARQQGFDWVLCLDGDGQHAAADIPAFLACAEQTGAAMVVGDRMAHPEGMPWLRRQVNRWMSRRLSRLSGKHLPDTQNGFRLINLACCAPQCTVAAHFEIESELLLDFLQQGVRVEFVPVTVIYESERSKIHPWRDTLRWFRWWRGAARRFRRARRDA
ncbi:MAG: glycosyltransferase family 2 protein [Verrucomicrobia bacterium]|nr:glycosyltransferase family 2 protein [Verrucomicrobiota bacterium]